VKLQPFSYEVNGTAVLVASIFETGWFSRGTFGHRHNYQPRAADRRGNQLPQAKKISLGDLPGSPRPQRDASDRFRCGVACIRKVPGQGQEGWQKGQSDAILLQNTRSVDSDCPHEWGKLIDGCASPQRCNGPAGPAVCTCKRGGGLVYHAALDANANVTIASLASGSEPGGLGCPQAAETWIGRQYEYFPSFFHIAELARADDLPLQGQARYTRFGVVGTLIVIDMAGACCGNPGWPTRVDWGG
jgi:hypothetical protein